MMIEEFKGGIADLT